MGWMVMVGALGVLFISLGVLTKERKKQDIYYILGGCCVLGYSIYLKDLVFILLQVIFIIAALYDEERVFFIKRRKK